jgi:hypothetical protein
MRKISICSSCRLYLSKTIIWMIIMTAINNVRIWLQKINHWKYLMSIERTCWVAELFFAIFKRIIQLTENITAKARKISIWDISSPTYWTNWKIVESRATIIIKIKIKIIEDFLVRLDGENSKIFFIVIPNLLDFDKLIK